jgi:hypothetical protein
VKGRNKVPATRKTTPKKKEEGIVVKQTMKEKEKGKETKSYLIKRESRQANEAL